jgi:hypothetical protein
VLSPSQVNLTGTVSPSESAELSSSSTAFLLRPATEGWVLNPGQVEELKPLMTNAIVQVGILLENG